MPTTDGFNSCGTFQQVSHTGVTPLHMRGSERYLEKQQSTRREADIAVRLAALGGLSHRVEVGKGGDWRPKGEAIVAQATNLSRECNASSECFWGLILAMLCMMRAGPARLPLVLPDASSSWAPVVAVERSRGSSLPRSSTRSG